MRKASVLLVGALALVFFAGASPIMANSNWSGTGTGTWYFPDSNTAIYPFQSWQGTIYTGVLPNVFSGTWSDNLSNSGTFSCDNKFGAYFFTGTWKRSFSERPEGQCYMYFNFSADTCSGTWTSYSGTGSGTWRGQEN